MTLQLSDFEAAMVDLDGTLIDTMGDFVVSLNRMLDDIGLPAIEAPEIEKRIGKGSEYLVRAVLTYVLAEKLAPRRAEAEVPDGEVQTWYDRGWPRYQHHYLEINGQHATVYPGVLEGLRGLKARGLRLACLTNKPGAFAHPLLASKGLDSFFDVVFGGDAFERKKPDPMPLVRTCEALHSTPARTLMIGDSVNDALAARAAGCRVVLVTYGYNHGNPIRAVDADRFVDSLAELA